MRSASGDTAKKSKKQQGSEIDVRGESQKKEDGYMRVLHKLKEKQYGPNSPLPPQAKVFDCITHEIIRWDQLETDELDYEEISKRTGVSEREVKKHIKKLESGKMLQVLRRKLGNKHLKNIYRFHPDTFGENREDILETKHAPKLSVINGGRDEKLSTVVSERTPSVVSERTPSVVTKWTPQNPSRPAQSQALQDPKELLKEQHKKLLRAGEVECSTFFKGKEEEDQQGKAPTHIGDILKRMGNRS